MAGPAAPSDLAAGAVSASRIRLTWRDNAADETGFKVERSANGVSGWVEVGRVEDNVTVFQNTGLTAETTYYYRVAAYNAGGDSAWSNVADATTLAAGVGECAVTPYATVADVQARIWTDLLAISDSTQPATADVEDWLCQESHWIDSTFAWRYAMPATEAADRERLRPACADLVAARCWRVLVPRNPGQESRPDELRGAALITLVYQPGSVRPVGSSLGRLATDPPREGRSFLVLPGTALADTGEAGLGAPESSYSDPDAEGGTERLFSVGMDL